MQITKHKNELLFVPLGGAGEIGMNLNLYHYKGKWLIIDLGAGFADEHLPGVDMIVPDITFLSKHKQDIVGLVLTHSHEDHYGAIQYLWNETECPIYATPFTANLLRTKLKEARFGREVPIFEVECNSKMNLGPFNLELVSLTHSAPEMQAIMIKTDLGNILHTGDWKFDHDPLIGEANDEALLKKYGDEGVLALVGDSTDVFNSGVSGSEGDLRASLTELIMNCKNMVVVTTFASNVARIETIIKAAEKCNRKVVLSGRSLHRITTAALESGYLSDIEDFIDERSIKNYARNEILIICTGCQGELLAATTKLANKSHHHIKLNPEDTVIFSSKIIPGNEKRIFHLFNCFVKMGINVLTEKDHFVHVSGHPSVDELKKMYELIKPQIAVPVHGELIHIHEHARYAKMWGVPTAIEMENGDVVRLAPGKAEKIGQVETGYLAVDGYYLHNKSSPVMKMRRRLQKDGVVIILLSYNRMTEKLSRPLVIAPGLLDNYEDKALLSEMADEISSAIAYSIPKNAKAKFFGELIEKQIRQSARKMIRKETGKEPVIEIHIQEC